MEAEEKLFIRKHIIQLVLATDMSEHFDKVSMFQMLVVQSRELEHLRGRRKWCQMNAKQKLLTVQMALKVTLSIHVLSSSSPRHYCPCTKLVLKVCMTSKLRYALTILLRNPRCTFSYPRQVADIGHCCIPLEQHLAWLKRLQNEFFQQVSAFDKERLASSLYAQANTPPIHANTRSSSLPCKFINVSNIKEYMPLSMLPRLDTSVITCRVTWRSHWAAKALLH
jgi:hypothetical protein